jgi:hypothetical protein
MKNTEILQQNYPYIPYSDESNIHPLEYRLYQNFPQSFYIATSIGFDLPEKITVKLAVYDVYGRNVVVLLNKELIPGSYEVKWNAFELQPGIYFYKIIAGDFVESKKMFLMKNHLKN